MTERDQIRTEIKRRLYSYRDMMIERAQLEDEIKRMEALGAYPSAPMDGMPRGDGPSNPVASHVVRLWALRDRYQAKIAQMAEQLTAIEAMIEELEPTERMLARYRYIDGLTWEDVCEKLCYSWRQTHRIHGRMLDRLVTKEIESQ